MHALSWIAYFFSAVGAINWGTTKFFKLNLVEYVCEMVKVKQLNMIVYAVVSLSGLYLLVSLFV